MNGLSFKIDAVTGDFVPSADGWYEEDTTATSAVHCQLTHHRDAWPAAPDDGSLLHLAHELGDGPDGQEFVDLETRRALAVLVDDGLIESALVTVARTDIGRLFVRTSYRDLSTGERVDDEIIPATGGG